MFGDIWKLNESKLRHYIQACLFTIKPAGRVVHDICMLSSGSQPRARSVNTNAARFNPNLGQQSGLVPALAAGLLLVVLEDLGCIVDNPIRLKLLNDCIQLTRERAIKILQGGYELLVRGPLLY